MRRSRGAPLAKANVFKRNGLRRRAPTTTTSESVFHPKATKTSRTRATPIKKRTTTKKAEDVRDQATPGPPNEAALSVLTDLGLLKTVASFASGMPGFVYLVMRRLVCARKPTDTVSPKDVELWHNAVLAGDKKTIEALLILAKTESLGPILCKVLRGIMGFASTHTKNYELLEWLDAIDIEPEGLGWYMIDDDEALGETGDIEMIKWLWEHNYTLEGRLTFGAARRGHLALIQLLRENEDFSFCFEGRLINEAVEHGHLEVVKYIHENRRELISLAEPARCDLIDKASARGDLEMVQYIHENGVGSSTCAAIEGAAANGHLNTVKYLHEHGLAYGGGSALNRAAANGHLDVVKYLIEHDLKGSSTEAIDDALVNHHMDVATFLYDTCEQHCSGKAMTNAMKSGDMELLATLCSFCDEGGLQAALFAAADLGSVKFMRFLFAKTNGNCRLRRKDLVNRAASEGNLELVKFYHEHDYFRFSRETMHAAAIANHLHVVKFLHEHRSEGCKVDTLFECEQRELARVVEFLCTKRPMRAPEKAIARAKREGRMLLAAKLEYGAKAKTTYEYRESDVLTKARRKAIRAVSRSPCE